MNDFFPTRAQSFDPILDHIGNGWMLISASDGKHTNTMTASWGGCGVLWNLPVALCWIRPERFTYGIIEAADYFSLSFLDEKHRDALRFCGTHSGKETDKFAAAGLTCRHTEMGVPFPDEALRVLICRKLYAAPLHADGFCDSSLLSHYQNGGMHKTFIGEIVTVLNKR